MTRLSEFEGPYRTLFLFERDAVRILSDDGGEALIPLRHGLAFLARLARLSSSPSPDAGSSPLRLGERPSRLGHGSEAGEDGAQSSGRIPTDPEGDDGIPPGTAIAVGESLLLFEHGSVLVLGVEATEARVPLEDLRALLDYLAETPLVSSTRGLRTMMTDVRLSSDVPLLAPSEWLVFRAIHEANSPLTPRQVASRCPSLVPSSVQSIVERLAGRQLLSSRETGWVTVDVDTSALIGRMLNYWVDSHALGSSDRLSELVRLLDARISRAAPPH
jgi:hypothetical protein